MAHPGALGRQIVLVLRPRRHDQRLPPDDPQPQLGQRRLLGRVGRQQPHLPHTEVGEHLDRLVIGAGVGGVAQLQVGVHGVEPGVLQRIRPQLLAQPDAAALVPADVDHCSAPFGPDQPQRLLELLAAVAAPRAERVAGQALGVHPDQRRRRVGGVVVGDAHAEHDVLLTGAIAEGRHPERPVLCRQQGVGQAEHGGGGAVQVRDGHLSSMRSRTRSLRSGRPRGRGRRRWRRPRRRRPPGAPRAGPRPPPPPPRARRQPGPPRRR